MKRLKVSLSTGILLRIYIGLLVHLYMVFSLTTRAELVSSEQRIKDMERDFHSEVEELEEELDNARKAEAR